MHIVEEALERRKKRKAYVKESKQRKVDQAPEGGPADRGKERSRQSRRKAR